MQKELKAFDFSVSPVDASLVTGLARGDFVEALSNVIFVGGSAAAKLTWAMAIGLSILRRRRKIRGAR